MKRTVLFLLLVLSALGTTAQSISVKSFQALPMDMTASSLEGKKIDQNGNVAALIKVMTTETGFVFEGGTLGIVDTQQRVGEIWVWVPRGLRKITILHQQLGGLRDYRFPIEIEAERTYEMVLTTAKIETIVKEEVRMQYLTFKISPVNATLEVNDKLWSVDADGVATKYVDFGTYTYRVRAADYVTDAGQVTVNDPDNTKMVTVTLKPSFVEVTLNVDADVEIWVNNEKKGIRTWTGALGEGSYRMECRKEGYETSVVTKEITLEMNGQTVELPVPRPIYGSLNVESTPQLATLYIDGKDCGTTPKSVNEILIGQHKIRISKEGYDDYTETITIAKGERKQVVSTLIKKEQEVDESEIYYTTVQEMPEFPGGLSSLADYLRENIKYPQLAQESGIQGRVFVSFIVETDGSVSNVSVLRSVGGGCDEEAVRVVKAMPKWKPGKHEGKTVRVSHVLPINFILQDGETFTVKGISFAMKLVEGGTFQMGATDEQWSDAEEYEKPVHRVSLSKYYIGETEVTQELWEVVMGTNPSRFKGDNLPVEQVSWDDIQGFLKKLNELTGKSFRLPTEAEWEYAARGGSKSKGYKYAGGNNIDEVAWYDKNTNFKGTKPVKSKHANELGLYDMSGNVGEWCQDWYDSYGSGYQANPTGPSSGLGRVVRGGSWSYDAKNCRVSRRPFPMPPGIRKSEIGFRLCLPQ